MFKKLAQEKGSALLLTLLILSSIFLVVFISADLVTSGIKMSRTQMHSSRAYFAAESGAERVTWEFSKNSFDTATCDTGECIKFSAYPLVCQECDNDTKVSLTNGSEYEVSVATSSPDLIMVSTGDYSGVKRAIELNFGTKASSSVSSPVCTDECFNGEVGCVGDSRWRCVIQGDGCYDQVVEEDCSSIGESCFEGVCSSWLAIDNCVELQAIGKDNVWVSGTCQGSCKYASYPLDADYIVTKNIDCSPTNPSNANWNEDVWPGTEGFEPIGLESVGDFRGAFNGSSYTISDLYMNRDYITSSEIGLFSNASNATFKDVALSNFDIIVETSGTIKVSLGALVGKIYDSEISSCSAYDIKIRLIGSGSIGGLAGTVSRKGLVSNSFVYNPDINVSGIPMSEDYGAGGLVGNLYRGVIQSSGVDGGSVSSEISAGGFVGFIDVSGSGAAGENPIIENSYSTASVQSNSNYYVSDFNGGGGFVGGILGGQLGDNITITDSFASGDVIGRGGFVGYIHHGNNASINIKNCYSTGNITNSDNESGGFIGALDGHYVTIEGCYSTGVADYGFAGFSDNHSTDIINSYWDLDVSGAAQGCERGASCATGLTTAEMESYATPSNEDNYNIWTFEDDANADWKLDEILRTGTETYYPCLSWQADGTCPIAQASVVVYACQDPAGGWNNDNAQLCTGDDAGLSADTDKTLVSTCTEETKCEYICGPGYIYEAGACVPFVCTPATFPMTFPVKFPICLSPG